MGALPSWWVEPDEGRPGRPAPEEGRARQRRSAPLLAVAEESRGDPAPIGDAGVFDVQGRAHNDLVARGPHRLDGLQRCGEGCGLAPAPAHRRLRFDAPHVAVGPRHKALDGIGSLLIGEAAAEVMGQKGGRVARNLHGPDSSSGVSFVSVIGNGGKALSRTPGRRPGHGHARPLGGVTAGIREDARGRRAPRGAGAMWRWMAYRCRRIGSEQGDSGTTANSLREVGETESARQAET